MTANGEIDDIRDALVRVVAEWTRSDLQLKVAAKIDETLDAAETRALYLVGMNGGALGFGQLAERAALSNPTTSKLISRMSAQGLVDRVRSGRTVEVRLTDAGADTYARLVAAGQQMVDGALSGWAPDEITQFQAHLSRFVAALPRATLAAASPTTPEPIPPQQEES
ncbi:MarR family winged helix-turn-helix transcriptional regulator [Microbacterium aurugineum]|uniref:MarR family winged helix-turn-helix transcriptional regulator n=1 Tax=Microbacterium aurugineum TaxID=2851642 RepID=UPI0020BFDD15|nr:MarR family transcriptional regulator [Microbacterium aurugineum]MCK8475862.1 MarR family transcriptional regulator [Microbacterium aurugineum]